MTHFQIFGLSLFGFLLAIGQVLFKLAARDTALVRQAADVTGLLATPWTWAALVIYGGTTLLWMLLLQRVPLSRAYPFAALGFVLVPMASAWLFGERITWSYVLGAVCIVIGIVIISSSE